MTKKLLKTTRYINQNTGEFREKMMFVNAQFDEDGYLFWSRKLSIKTFVEIPFPATFTWAEKGRINELKHYILKDNQLLVYRSGNYLKPVDTSEMCRIFDMSLRQCKGLINKMKAHKILKEILIDTTKYYAFSPLYGFKGNRLSITTYLIFQDELKDQLPKWVIDEFARQASQISPIIKIL